MKAILADWVKEYLLEGDIAVVWPMSTNWFDCEFEVLKKTEWEFDPCLKEEDLSKNAPDASSEPSLTSTSGEGCSG